MSIGSIASKGAEALAGLATTGLKQAEKASGVSTALSNAGGLTGMAKGLSPLKNPFSSVSVPSASSAPSAFRAAMQGRMGGGATSMVKDMVKSGGPLGMIKNMATDAISGGAADLISMSPFGKPLEKLASAVAPVTGLAEKAVGLASNVMPALAPLDVGLKTVNDLAEKA